MYKFLLIQEGKEPDSTKREFFEREFEAQIDICSDLHAFESIENIEHFDLFIIDREDSTDEDCSLHKKFINKIYDLEEVAPIILIGTTEIAYSNLFILSRWSATELRKLLLKLLSIEKDQLHLIRNSGFLAFPLRNFYFLEKAPCDLFIKIEGQGRSQYIKKVHATDLIQATVLKEYAEQGVEELYLPSGEWIMVLEELTRKIDHVIDEQKKIVSEDFETLLIHLELEPYFFLMKDLIHYHSGYSYSEKFLHHFVRNLKKSLKLIKSPSVWARDILLSSLSLEYRSVILQAILSVKLLPHLDGFKSNDTTIDQLLYSCVLKDVFLYSEDQVFVNDSDSYEIYKSNASPEEAAQVLDHAKLASQMALKLNHLPSNVDVLIRQHHGQEKTNFFPLTPSVSLFPLAMSLVIIDGFVVYLLGLEDGEVTPRSLKMHAEQFSLGIKSVTYHNMAKKLQLMMV
jgi:hypothetical protein